MSSNVNGEGEITHFPTCNLSSSIEHLARRRSENVTETLDKPHCMVVPLSRSGWKGGTLTGHTHITCYRLLLSLPCWLDASS